MAVDIIARGMAANASSKGGDYESLTNLPQINGHELKGNLSSDSLGLQEAIQFEEMPEASADYLGKVYQYIGETETYKQGSFYICTTDGEEPPSFQWVELSSLDDYYTKEEVDTITNRIEAIAKGRATGYVFNTKADMDLWLEDEEHVAKLNMGDNLYIIDRDTPDYWWDGTQPQELETQKVDLSEYYKKSETDAKIDEKIAALDVYTKAQTDSKIDEKIAAIPTNTLLHYQGHVNSVDDLPSTGQESGIRIGTPVSINATVRKYLEGTFTSVGYFNSFRNKLEAKKGARPYYIGVGEREQYRWGVGMYFDDINQILGMCYYQYSSAAPLYVFTVKATPENPINIIQVGDTYYSGNIYIYVLNMDGTRRSRGTSATITSDAIVCIYTYFTSTGSNYSSCLASNTGMTLKYLPQTIICGGYDDQPKDVTGKIESALCSYDTSKTYIYNEGMNFLAFNLDTGSGTLVQNDPSPLAIENAMYTVGDSYDIYVCDNRPHWNLWSEAKVKVDEDTINMNSDSELQSIGNILQNGGFQHYWKGTKVEYTAIEEKDPNTLYEILDDEETALFEVDGNTIEFSPDGLLRVPNNMDMMFQSVTYGNHESGYRKWRNGFIEQWGVTTSSADGEVEFTMHQPHIDQNFSVFVEPREMGNFFHYAIPSANQKFKCRIQTRDSQNMAVRFQWHSYGYFK